MTETAVIARAEVELEKLLGVTPLWNHQLATRFSIARCLFVLASWRPKPTAGNC